MSSDQYLTSGKIEAYVLGYISEQDKSDIETVRQKNPEIDKAINEAELALEIYIKAHKKTPPPYIKEKVLKHFESSNNFASNPLPLASSSNAISSYKNYKGYAVAASILALVSLLFSSYLYFQLKEAQEIIATLYEEHSLMSSNFESIKAGYEEKSQQLALLNDANTKIIELKGLDSSSQSMVRLYWDKGTGDTYLNTAYLPETSPDKQYQLWAIVDGKPVDMGVFDVNDSWNKMNNINHAEAFAITLENKGGSEAPTLDQMRAKGVVS